MKGRIRPGNIAPANKSEIVTVSGEKIPIFN